MKDTKRENGITLIALTITIIVLIIIAGISTYTGISTIKSSKLTKFKQQLEIMQAQVDMLYEKYKKDDGTLNDEEINKIGKDISSYLDTEEVDDIFNQVYSIDSIDSINRDTYRYYDKETIESLDISGIDDEYLVSIHDRLVISINGIESEGTLYRVLYQFPDKERVSNNFERGEVSFLVDTEETSNGWKINISNIKYSKYVGKGDIVYQKKGNTDWTTVITDLKNDRYSFIIKNPGKYNIKIIDAAGVEKTLEISINQLEDKPEVSTETQFTRAYGVIEIEFLSETSYNITTTPNEPNMTSDMKAVYWENGEEKVEGESADFDKNKWYSYIEQTGATTSGGTSRWANAKTSDGSYWVWIPRYAYRIVYFDTEAHRDAYRADNTQTTGIVGYSDARGLVDKDGKTPSDLQEPVTSIGVGENKLRPHPAFETDLNQGGWDTKLEGIWVAKYEVSQSGTTIKSIPGVSSYRSITIGTMYTKGYDYDREKESHMMKNSEWGAVAYLTESKYGRNGTAVTRNSNSNYYTGGTSGATALTNPLQSTTGNEYGIYDTVGGAYEYVAGYIADSSQSYGNPFASTDNTTNNKTNSIKYATVYRMSTSNRDTENYKENINKIFGDGTIETSTSGIGSTSWHSAYSYFVGIYNSNNFPFFVRGGFYGYSDAGSFSFYFGNGDSNGNSGFHVCLAVK